MQFRKEWIPPIFIGVSTFGAGFGVGYILAKRRNIVSVVNVVEESDIQDIEETPEQTEHNRLLTNYDKVFDPKVVIEEDQLLETHDSFRERLAIEEVVMEERAVEELSKIIEAKNNGAGKFNIFEGADSDWDYVVEVAKRGKVDPFIIHREEFESNEEGNSQSSLTYYAIDDILADEHDVPIFNHNAIVGELTFGKGSEDPSICYVRNPKLQAEYEVIIDHGSFQVQVLGEKIEQEFEDNDIKHSRHPRRFREED